jgi:hypothetical protein
MNEERVKDNDVTLLSYFFTSLTLTNGHVAKHNNNQPKKNDGSENIAKFIFVYLN